MKKILAWSFGFVFIAFVAVLVLGTIFFKPIVKEQIVYQLQKMGFEEAAIDDLAVGLYSTTISGLQLDTSGNNRIETISASYWPQQIFNKRLHNVSIIAPQLEIIFEADGGILISGYRLVSLETDAQTALPAIQTTPTYGTKIEYADLSNHYAHDAIIVAQATPSTTVAKSGTTSPATASDRLLPPDLPMNSITIKDADFKLHTPSKKVIQGKASVEIDTRTESVKGNIKIPSVNPAALLEMARLFQPDLVPQLKTISGNMSVEANFLLPTLTDFANIPGQAIIKFNQSTLTYDDIQVRGLSGDLRLSHLNPPTLPRGQIIAADQIQKAAISMQNAHTEFGLDKMRHLDVNHASLELAGGIISAAPFKIDLQNINTIINLRVLHVRLASLAQLFGLQGFNIGGEFEGTIPIAVNQSGIRIDQRDLLQATGATIDRMLPEATRQRIDRKLEQLGGAGSIINETLGRQPSQQQQQPQKQPESAPQQEQRPAESPQQPAEQLLQDFLGGSGLFRR